MNILQQVKNKDIKVPWKEKIQIMEKSKLKVLSISKKIPNRNIGEVQVTNHQLANPKNLSTNRFVKKKNK